MEDINNGNVGWYVVATQTNYEKKVADGILKAAASKRMDDLILETKVPIETVTEITKSGVKKTVERKTMPGYVFCKMVMTDETWNLIKNITGAACIIGFERNEPDPLRQEEVWAWGLEPRPSEDADDFDIIDTSDLFITPEPERIVVSFVPGMTVVVKEGHPFAGKLGTVNSVDIDAGTLNITLTESSLKLSFDLEFADVMEYDPE